MKINGVDVNIMSNGNPQNIVILEEKLENNGRILNLTTRSLTRAEEDAGAYDLPYADRQKLKKLYAFGTIPTAKEMIDRVNQVACLANGENWEEICGRNWEEKLGMEPNYEYDGSNVPRAAIIGGRAGSQPVLIPLLAQVLKECGIQPVFSFFNEEGNFVDFFPAVNDQFSSEYDESDEW